MTEEQLAKSEQQNINKWDLPAKSDLFQREPFVDAIVKTIEDSDEGFNFGISARWGEGKSSILEQLAPKLEKLNYKVLKFHPWKYTQDQISVKRKFLIEIYSQLNKDYDEAEFYGDTEKEKKLSSEEYDAIFVDQLKNFIPYAFWTAIVFLFILIILDKVFGVDLNITQIFLNNLFIPIFAGLLPFIQKIAEIKVKQVIPRIESAEQFEKRFNQVIDEIFKSEKPPKKIIIFVDDLDRCNHKEVEQVLTALFTFFNNPRCTYVITADHMVIRRYISNFLSLDQELDDDGKVDIKRTNEIKHEEATEYLKKIFQINFILPKATNDVLEPWVKGLINKMPIIGFSHPYAEEYLVNLALNNFDSNPRKIKHFLRTLAFQLEAVQEKIKFLKPKNDKEAENLTKVKESPELLAKILVIQDRFPDFYERLKFEPRLLQKYETGDVTEEKNPQIQTLIAQEPKFFDSITREEKDKNIDPYYFLYFSGSTGFTETRSTDPTEVKNFAKAGDIENLEKIFSALTDIPRNKHIEDIRAGLDDPKTQPPEKVNIMRGLLHAVSSLEEPRLRLQKLRDIIKPKSTNQVELAGLQSIDFEKALPFIDEQIAENLLKEAPFSSPPLKTQIANAFIAQQDIVSKEVAQKFENAISEKLMETGPEFQEALQLIKQLSLDRFKESESTQNNLIDCLKNKPNEEKSIILDIFLGHKDSVEKKKMDQIHAIIIDLIQKGNISDAMFVISLIPTKINNGNFDLKKLLNAYIHKIETVDHAELTQITNALLHPTIKAELGDKEHKKFIEAFIDLLNSKDANKQSYVISRIPEIIKIVSLPNDLVDQLMEIIEEASSPLDVKIAEAVWGAKDTWISNNSAKQKFTSKVKSMQKKKKNDEFTRFVNQILPELEPKKEDQKMNL
ncbi:MAG: P-loop NTPase fold protein [Candidatus Giovannonibacteria bacterium]|nr:P-loop NTPase fold protein [Candidatus Giovannonibacteria bacterium]